MLAALIGDLQHGIRDIDIGPCLDELSFIFSFLLFLGNGPCIAFHDGIIFLFIIICD